MESYLRVNLLGPGPRLMKKDIYRAAVSQRLRNAALNYHTDCAYVHDFLSRLKLRREHSKVHCLRGNRSYLGGRTTNYD